MKGNLGKLATLGAVSTFLTTQFGMTEEEAEEELARDPATYLRRYYTNLNPNAGSEEIEEFVRQNSADGGRIGFDEGTPRGLQAIPELEGTPERLKGIPELQGLGSIMDEEMVVIIQFDQDGKPVLVQVPKSQVMGDNYMKDKIMKSNQIIRRDNKAQGDTASDNAMQAAGIEGLPIRQNPKGVKELDLRDSGGFIPPVGIKEKEDDIPAMLSNNEFVFTADAVRGMGDGDVDVGAQRMYDMMKQLEAGGRV